MSISVAMICRDEESNVDACLETVRWADELVLVDGRSTDQTLVKARRYTPHIYEVPFRDFAAQKNEALERTHGDWVFFIDADERVPDDLAGEIQSVCRSESPQAAYAVNRLNYFFGKPLRFSGSQDDFPIRLFPRGKARFEQPVHEHAVTDLPVRRLKHRLLHYSTRNFSHYRSKLDRYVSLELETMHQQQRRARAWDILLRPPVRFLSLYFGKRGFLDGLAGLEFAFLSSYYTFLKHWKFYRLNHP